MFSVDTLLAQHFPRLHGSPTLAPLSKRALAWLFNEQAFQQFASRYPHLRGLDFVEQVLAQLDFDYRVSEAQLEHIPASGRVIIVANHPIGSLDGLALLRLLGRIRPDVKIVANQLLAQLTPLRSLLLPVDNLGGKTDRRAILAMGEHLAGEGALVIFPAGEVSRLGPKGVKDGPWQGGFIKLAQRTRTPLVPIHLGGRNSLGFYLLSWLSKPASGLLLVRQLFRQQGQTLPMTIGARIPPASLGELPAKTTARLVRSHLYRIGRGRAGKLATEAPIALPEDRRLLKQAIDRCEVLGHTLDGQSILLYRRHETGHSVILRELGRLREIAFRAVGEGSGKRRDLDGFDDDYYHLILWDPARLDIIGAYRFAPVAELLASKGLGGLYSHTLFGFEEKLLPRLEQAIELGRSFIQPAYWGKRGLDYLWFGIGAYLARYPDYRYLFGPVSLSGSLPPAAKDLLVSFYRQHFAPTLALAPSRRPYPMTTQLFAGTDYGADLKELKARLDNLGCAIPTLYKQYSELCEPGGVQFMDFGIDPDFNHCIDGLVWVDVSRIKPHKRARYIGNPQDVELIPGDGRTPQ
ncbi:lysophospholipid acyltransferase family protein [Aeromonas enteropelogenes]|uniref:lysophospholipid acyltransferase family protein n=1 Tax=Aeromonas enteropelogenes TaxID=29489 RepID=UPI001CE28CFA|nr:lysophospholipid acyltransferase family protein [Aeromonas enteropelogenes]UCA12846.1 lysophospholipid acyltransferase family protein [Aeromonas enteropelogenes]